MNSVNNLASPLEAKKQYLLSCVSEILQARGMEKPEGYLADNQADLIFRRGAEMMLVEMKTPSLYREPDFRAAIGDAILRYQHDALRLQHPRRDLLLAFYIQRMSRKSIEVLRQYAAEYLPELNWIILSQDGSAQLRLENQEESIRVHPFEDGSLQLHDPSRGSLFSPKNQWLFKLLLLPGLDSKYWGGPAIAPSSVNALAAASGVSQPVVSSFLGNGERAGFIKRSANGFRIQHHRELLEDWGYALKHGRSKGIGARSLYGDEPEASILKKLKSSNDASSPPSVVIGGHLACHLMGLGRSSVRSARLYAAGPIAEVLRAMDLVVDESESAPLRVVSLPASEVVFRGFVRAEGVPVADILQCYFDVRFSYARGLEQSEYLYERILKPHFERIP
ncbi:MAG: hypothetical protein O3B24_07215 [Verrucomicrobia bacterium]|nr:hypothetical protein [Verrucomicrobiota bacterium]